MKRAKLFPNGRSQAVRLPKEFRFTGTEVLIERRGEEVVLRPVHPSPELAGLKTLGDVAKYFRETGGVSPEFERAVREARHEHGEWPPRGWK